ncbi:MAG: DUF58 domain-containing protein, partial [Stackebrandtia sp.]
LSAKPRRAPRARLLLESGAVTEGEDVAARVEVRNDDEADVVAVVNARVSPWVRLRYGVGSYAEVLSHQASTSVWLRGVARRWGVHQIGPASVYAVAADGLLRSRVTRLPAQPLRVYPAAELFDSREALPRAAGMAGIHRSRRLGQAGELAEVRQFQPGDRLRRIDWRVSLRQRELYVNSTLSERDADVVLLMDVLHEAGDPGGPGGSAEGSVMDVAVRAAAAIAEHYVHQGDRISIVEFGPRARRLRAGTGRRHYLAAREWLAETRAAPGAGVSMDRLVGGGSLPPGSVVVMLTPLLDERSAHGLARLARSGRALVTVDTLPPNAGPDYRGIWTRPAVGLWRLERENTLDRLRELGVPVETWRGPGSLDAMLRHISRIDRAPKAATR